MKLIVMQGESGSGKSTKAREMVDKQQNTVRLNRDDIRAMLHNKSGSRQLESAVIDMQKASAAELLRAGFNVIIDDTNLNPKTVDGWRRFAEGLVRAEFVLKRMDTPFETCISQDRWGHGRARVGRAVIERQFLVSKRLPWKSDLPVVLVDVDGTLASADGVRSVYDESRVIHDNPRMDIVEQVRELSKTRNIFIVSGRRSTCGEYTVLWLNHHKIPFDHIFMRHAWDNRKDTEVKKQILDEILGVVPKEKIVLVIDDRPSVLNMWFDNGLKIQPAREVKEPF